jgi:hypothetical protein
MEQMQIVGHYHVWCTDVDGNVLWDENFDNLVTTVGKNSMLDNYLAASSFSNTLFMGLISSTSFTAVNAADTGASHAGWLEGGNANAPTYTAPRPTAAWASASAGAKALSAALSFAITGTGTIKGVFMVGGSGAVATIDNTGGTLFSAGLFTGGDQAVVNTNTVNVSYSVSL